MGLRVGIGYDVHKLTENRDLILGGVKIPYHLGLLGHSDADVLTHAIADSLLGAAAKGDIGKYFPDNDPKYKDIDSLKILEYVVNDLKKDGYLIINIDCVIVAQQPKLLPYIDDMVNTVCNVLQISSNCVNIKATTEEGLGFTGEGLGIASKVVCMIQSN